MYITISEQPPPFESDILLKIKKIKITVTRRCPVPSGDFKYMASFLIGKGCTFLRNMKCQRIPAVNKEKLTSTFTLITHRFRGKHIHYKMDINVFNNGAQELLQRKKIQRERSVEKAMVFPFYNFCSFSAAGKGYNKEPWRGWSHRIGEMIYSYWWIFTYFMMQNHT